MNTAEQISTLSTCSRIKVGCVLVKDRQILSQGYNGVPKGWTHCEQEFLGRFSRYLAKNPNSHITFDEYMILPEIKEEHHEFSKQYELHSEINCIARCATLGIPTKGTTLYVTTSPCSDCSKAIIAAGIKEVIYLNLYDRDTKGLHVMSTSGILVHSIKDVLREELANTKNKLELENVKNGI
jgi:dCMP deaminase